MPEIVGRLRTPRLAAAPSSPVVGEMYYDTGTNVLYWWNGTLWVSASGGGGGATEVALQTAQPSPRNDLLLWIDPDEPATPMYAPPALVTSLPASPTDGLEVYYVGPTAPFHTWHVKYRAAWHTADGYGWTVVGAAPITGENNTVSTRASTAFGDLADAAASPSVNIPVAGLYDISWGAYCRVNVAGGSAIIGIQGGGMGVTDNYSCQFDSGGTNYGGTVMSKIRERALTAGSIALYYRASANTITAGRRWITITPIRLKST